MTDNEIIKALDSVGTANGVALGHHSGQADIIADRFRELISENGHLKAEIEKKQKVLDEVLELAEMGLAGIDDHDRKIKSEAIKEFAERLKEKSFQSFGNYGITRDVVEVCDIDNLVKEMVGENNA